MFNTKLKKVCFLIISIYIFPALIHPQTEWARHPENPVLISGGTGTWEENFSVVNSVLFHENIYKMWYEGNDGFGYATSVDEVSWIKDSLNNPVLEPGPIGSWDETAINNASVLIIDNTYHMWYSGVDGFNDNRIGHATSSDGINWDKDTSNPVLDLGDPGSWDDHELIHPFVMYEDSIYRMYYNGHDGTTQRILYAYSTDAIEWERYTVNPMLEPGNPTAWDGYELGPLCVVAHQDSFYMWYTGFKQDTTVRIGYATSPDGINWVKYSNNPVLDFGNPGEWDDAGVALPFVMVDAEDTLYKMWYGGGNGFLVQTGYATSDLLVSVEKSSEIFPKKFILYQNYPNPFNPGTKIRFSIPELRFTILKVYDILGNEVATLVNEEKPAGSYEISFNSEGLTSGIYFYQLRAGSFAQTKKMLLLK